MVHTAVRAPVGEYAPFKISLVLFLTTVLSTKIANTDKAAVLGAALYGASLSRQFKTKPIRVSDIRVHDIQASYFPTASTANSQKYHQRNLPSRIQSWREEGSDFQEEGGLFPFFFFFSGLYSRLSVRAGSPPSLFSV